MGALTPRKPAGPPGALCLRSLASGPVPGGFESRCSFGVQDQGEGTSVWMLSGANSSNLREASVESSLVTSDVNV